MVNKHWSVASVEGARIAPACEGSAVLRSLTAQALCLLSEPLRELRCIPAAAKRFDQQNAGFEASLHDVDVVALVLQQRGLPGNDLEIGIDAALVTGIEEIERLLRRVSRVVLLARFDLKIVQCVQVVLNLLECGEHGLTVGGNGAIVLREGNVCGGAAAAMIEEGLRQRGADGEEATRPREPVDRGCAREASDSGEG